VGWAVANGWAADLATIHNIPSDTALFKPNPPAFIGETELT
jgi:hypothetical protein